MGRRRVERLDRGFCPLCGRAVLVLEGAQILQDNALICGECVRKLRVMYPYQKNAKEDALKSLTTTQAMEAMGKVIAFIENFREHFNYCNAVFAVNGIEKGKGGLFSPPVYYLSGRVIYGCFSPDDEVTVKHGSTLYHCTLQAANPDVPIADNFPFLSGEHAAAGFPARLQIQARNIEIAIGDLIVK